jgi:uncharacterized protein (DUF952 family)
MPVIYHITTDMSWKMAQQNLSADKETFYYEHPSLQSEGFIHCAMEHQVPGVIKRYFSSRQNLIKLEIDTEKLTSKFIFDWSSSLQDSFPHIYGPINSNAVIQVIPL